MSFAENDGFLKMADGFSLFYRHVEPFQKIRRVVVFIHGIGGHSGGFMGFAKYLANSGVEFYGIDLRGFGNSKEADLPRGDTKDFKRHLLDINDVICFVRQKHPGEKIFIVGASLGGCYALWYAATHMTSLDGLIMIAPAIETKPRFPPDVREKMPALFASAPGTMIEGRKLESAGSALPEDPLRTSTFSVRYLVTLGAVLKGDKPFGYASSVRLPTLLVQGEADTEALPTGARRLFEALAAKDKTLIMVPDADHFFWKSTKEFCDPIIDWLKTH